jgi:amino acid transporter
MIFPPHHVVLGVVTNLVVFLTTFLLSKAIFAKLGWNPRKEQKGLQIWELFVVFIVFAVFMTVVCYQCSVVVDGIVAGVVLAILLNVVYEVRNKQISI